MIYYKNLIISTLLDIRPEAFSVRDPRNRNFLLSPLNFLRTIKISSWDLIVSTPY